MLMIKFHKWDLYNLGNFKLKENPISDCFQGPHSELVVNKSIKDPNTIDLDPNIEEDLAGL
jgi:hypothetical protein